MLQFLINSLKIKKLVVIILIIETLNCVILKTNWTHSFFKFFLFLFFISSQYSLLNIFLYNNYKFLFYYGWYSCFYLFYDFFFLLTVVIEVVNCALRKRMSTNSWLKLKVRAWMKMKNCDWKNWLKSSLNCRLKRNQPPN